MDMESIRRMIAEDSYHRVGERLDYFLPPFTILDLADCIIMEWIKPLFEQTMPKKSLRAHIEQSGIIANDNQQDAVRMQYSRLLKYAQYYRTVQAEAVTAESGLVPEELLPDDMSSQMNKVKGHQLTDMQFFELQMMGRLPLLKAIVNRRISDIEKISHKTLRGLLNEYDGVVGKLKASASADARSYVFNTYALYTLEWKFFIGFAHAAICASEAIPGSDPFDAARILTGRAQIHTDTGTFLTDNRFVLHRNELISDALRVSSVASVSRKMAVYLTIKCNAENIMINGCRGVDFLGKETTLEDWAEFMRKHYPLLENYATHDWTNARIRSYRNLMERMTEKIPPPQTPPKKKKSSSK